MKSFLPILSAFTALSTAQYTNQSQPFNLYLISPDSSVNGSTLSACHVGAAIESLCVSQSNSTSKPDPIPAATFYFNTSDSIISPDPSIGQPGILTFWLGAIPPIPSSVSLFYQPTTNTALPLLYPSEGTGDSMEFDSDDTLGIVGYLDYSVSPPQYGGPKVYERWYVCATNYSGYQYVNLVWVVGDGEPETPGCVSVKVKRVFI